MPTYQTYAVEARDKIYQLPMTTEEIITQYRDAKDKNKQIVILADMCLTKPQVIIDVLTQNGAISGIKAATKKSKNRSRYQWDAESEERLLALKREGLTNLQIAERFGLTDTAIRAKLLKLRPPAQRTSRESNAELDVFLAQLSYLIRLLPVSAQIVSCGASHERAHVRVEDNGKNYYLTISEGDGNIAE